MSIALAPDLRERVLEAVERDHTSLSDWMTAAVEAKLQAEQDAEVLAKAAHERRMKGLGQFLDEWEAEHGAFTDEEMERASRELGLPWPPEGENA